MKRTVFEGKVLSYLVLQIVNILITVVTFGFGTPWVLVRIYRWEAKNTVIDGKRFRFNGSAVNLFGHWILWWILTIITLGLYAIVVRVRIIEWRVVNTELYDEGAY